MAIFSSMTRKVQVDDAAQVRLLTVCHSEMTEELSELLIADSLVELDVVGSLQNFDQLRVAAQSEYHGIVIDMWTYSALKAEDKDVIHSIARGYPVCLVRKAFGNRLRCVHPEHSGSFSFKEFVAMIQKSGQPRPVRLQQRHGLHLNVTLSKVMQSSILAESIEVIREQVAALNVSKGGAYVLTSGDYTVGDIVNLSIPVLGETKSVRSEVRWVRKWDDNGVGLPGIGVQFMNLSAGQLDALEALTPVKK